MKFHIYEEKKKSRKNYLILNFLAHCTGYQSVYGDESSLMVNHVYLGLWVWERALLQIPYYIDCDIVPTTSNLILLGWKIII